MPRDSIRLAAAAAALTLLVGAAACNRGAEDAADGSGVGPIGVDFPRADSDFWNSYNSYVPAQAKELDIDLLPPTSSDNDVQKLVANTQSLVGRGAKAIVMAPQDTAAIASTLDNMAGRKIPVVSVDTRPDKGKVFMVVRADNRAYGEKACRFVGEKLRGQGSAGPAAKLNVVQFQGSLSSVNGRDRSEAFSACMKQRYPGITVYDIPTEWEGTKAAAGLQTVLTRTGNTVHGIYMQAGGVFLAPTLQVLKQRNLLVPPSDPKHVAIVSNDGIPQELAAIRNGEIDATVSQPADAYARWGLFYAKAAAEGRTFKPGPTDHDSTIIALPNGLEDQLPAPLVTREAGTHGDIPSIAVDDRSLWGNQV